MLVGILRFEQKRNLLVFVIVFPLNEKGVNRTTQLHVLDDLITCHLLNTFLCSFLIFACYQSLQHQLHSYKRHYQNVFFSQFSSCVSLRYLKFEELRREDPSPAWIVHQ